MKRTGSFAIAVLTTLGLLQGSAQADESDSHPKGKPPSAQTTKYLEAGAPPSLPTAAPLEGASIVSPLPCTPCRPELTGDWGGRRSRLERCGIALGVRVTQFQYGLRGGINRPVPAPLGQGDTSSYTGRGEYDVRLDLQKLVGMRGGRFLVRFENWWGDLGNVSLNTGAFTPAVFPALLPPAPSDEGVPFLTNFLWTQPLSKSFAFFIGKKDVLGALDQDDFAGGDGSQQFINQALIANPAFLLGLPYTSYCAGVSLRQPWGGIGAYVYDATDRSSEYLRLDNLFNAGFVVGGEVKFLSKLFGKPGQHHLGAVWKHKSLPDLGFGAALPGVFPTPSATGVRRIEDSYTLYYGFDQHLEVLSSAPRKGWGVFGRASLSDGNPTPLRYFLSAGIGGDSPFAHHRGDRFGIGLYYLGATDEWGPVPRALLDPRSGYGAEIYYSFQVTRWMSITPDLQFQQPASRGITDVAFLAGLRMTLDL